MRIIELSAKEIITLNDFPVHNEHILKIYFLVYQKNCGDILSPCPVMHKNLVLKHFSLKLKKILEPFFVENLKAKYFLLDGSHRTTAACLTKNKINAMVIKSEKDIREAKSLAQSGEHLQCLLDATIKKIIADLIKHFEKKSYFETVEQKTRRMVAEKVIPKYMILNYKRK